jgi:hypothetical protein
MEKTVKEIAVLNTGFLGLLESGMEVDCRINNASIQDFQASIFYFGGEVEMPKEFCNDMQIYFMTLTITKGKSKITLVHNFNNRVSYACQKETFSFLSQWRPGTELTLVDNSYLV